MVRFSVLPEFAYLRRDGRVRKGVLDPGPRSRRAVRSCFLFLVVVLLFVVVFGVVGVCVCVKVKVCDVFFLFLWFSLPFECFCLCRLLPFAFRLNSQRVFDRSEDIT